MSSLISINDNMTFEELFESWLSEKRESITEASYRRYIQFFEEYAKTRFGHQKVNEISIRDWEEFENLIPEQTYSDGRAISAAKVRRILDMFHSVFEYGSMVYGLNVPVKVIIKPSEITIETFSNDEIEKMRNAVKAFDMNHLGIMLSLYTGMTRAELCGVKWGDIDTTGRQIKIRRLGITRGSENEKSKGDFKIADLKNEAELRDLPLPDWIAEQLEIMKPSHDDDQQILEEPFEGISPSRFNSCYKNFLKYLDIPYRGFQSLRHTFAVKCIEDGMDIKELSKLLGDTNVNVTYRQYEKEIKKIRAEKLYE